MFVEKVQQLVEMLERQELENDQNMLSPSLYLELFAGYLFLNDLSNARYLWKRIPQSIKNGNSELEQMSKVHQCLWKCDLPEFYRIINFEWSRTVTELMFELKEKIQLEAIELIGRAYTSIYEDKFAEMTNQLSPERVTETCKNLDWPIQDDLEAGKRLIIPNKSTGGKANSLNSDEILQQLYRLTDFVSFLEN